MKKVLSSWLLLLVSRCSRQDQAFVAFQGDGVFAFTVKQNQNNYVYENE